jgi:tetratricopeptide (TPR) repeat protein
MHDRGSNSRRNAAAHSLQIFQRAVAFHEQRRLWEAEQLFEIIVKEDDRHFGAIYRLGLIRLQQRKFADAARLFRRAIKIDRNSADAQFHLAVALTGLERIDEAIQRYERTLALRPSFPEAYNNLGHALQLLGRDQEAVAQYEKALAIIPNYAEARNNLGNALQKLGRFAEAIAQYEKALALRPSYAEASNNLGNALAAIERYEEAIVRYEKTLAIRPRYAEAHYSWAGALAALGRPREALKQYEKAISTKPDYADAHLGLANALVAVGRHEDAIAQYQNALAIRPDHVETLAALAHAWMRMGEDSKAAKLYEDLIKRRACSVTVLLALALRSPALRIDIDLLSELYRISTHGERSTPQFENFAGFVRAAALDRAGRHAEAWRHLQAVNQASFAAGREELHTETERQRASLDRLTHSPVPTVDAPRQDKAIVSLFILGPSRSGKTTLEKLVGALPLVKRGYENFVVEDAVHRTLREAGLAAGISLETLPSTLRARCREIYLEEVVRRAGPNQVFTGTHPGRVYDADLIAAIFPNVRFVGVKRNVEDNVLRMYQRRYHRGYVHSYDVKAAYDHVAWYNEMLDLLADKFPRLVRVIGYEEMVAEPAGVLRVAAQLCGLAAADTPLPSIEDDRGCAAPYRQLIAAEAGTGGSGSD